MALKSMKHTRLLLLVIITIIFCVLGNYVLLHKVALNNLKTQDIPSIQSNNDVNFETATVEVNDKKINFTGINNTSTTCKRRYILLTTQRSGSTWFCDILNHQEDIACGGCPNIKKKGYESELMLKYSSTWADTPNIKFSDYVTDLERAFDEACCKGSALSIGFKLMYNQIPPQFLEDGKLESYLREHNISIIHLVREAKILRMASWYNAKQQSESGNLINTRNETFAATLRDTPKLPWTEETITEMIELENVSLEWQKKIQFMPNVPLHYLNYESLIDKKEMVETLRQVSGFLANKIPDSSNVSTDANLFQLHESLCSDRIEDYENFRAHDKVRESRSAAACDMIEFFKNV